MPKKQESRELELPPDLVEHLISLGPEDAVAYLLDVPDLNLSVAEAEDVVYSLLQEQHLSAELAQELLRRDPIEAIALLLELPLELTPELAAGLVGQLRQDFQEQYLTPEIVAEVLRRQPDEAVRWLLPLKVPTASVAAGASPEMAAAQLAREVRTWIVSC